MINYSVQPQDQMFVKGYGFMCFAKNSENIGKNIGKNLSGKYTLIFLDHAKQSATDALKTALKREIRKTAEVTGDLIGIKIAGKIIKILKTSEQDNSETVTNEHDKEIAKEKDISPEESQKIIEDLRLI